MSDINKEKVIERLNWRYAVKKFDGDKKVSDEDFKILEDAMALAPSSYGLQPYKFIVVTDDETKEKLLSACFNQSQIVDSSHLVVFAAKKVLDDDFVDEYVHRLQEVRGNEKPANEGYVNQMKGKMNHLTQSGNAVSWSQRQAYIALGFLLETAAVLEIDACPMEGFEPEKVDEILGLEDYTASVLCAIGYRAEEDRMANLAKVRFPKDKLIERF